MSKDILRPITARINGECIALRVRLLNRSVTAIYDDALRELGLTANQFNLLIAVSRMGKAMPNRLSTVMLMAPSTVSRSVERMRRAGLLKGTTGDDARSRELSVTEKGLNILERAFPLWQKAQVCARELLGPKNASALNEATESIWSKVRSV
jgi:DNA-binding MarR family transcriptional regulator